MDSKLKTIEQNYNRYNKFVMKYKLRWFFFTWMIWYVGTSVIRGWLGLIQEGKRDHFFITAPIFVNLLYTYLFMFVSLVFVYVVFFQWLFERKFVFKDWLFCMIFSFPIPFVFVGIYVDSIGKQPAFDYRFFADVILLTGLILFIPAKAVMTIWERIKPEN